MLLEQFKQPQEHRITQQIVTVPLSRGRHSREQNPEPSQSWGPTRPEVLPDSFPLMEGPIVPGSKRDLPSSRSVLSQEALRPELGIATPCDVVGDVLS